MLKLFTILICFVGSVYASIGSITKSLGDIYIIRDMKSQKANIGDKILTKDLLFSRSKSKVEITFIDETVISIGQKSTFLIEDYFFDENDKVNSRCSFKFSKGSFRSVSGKLGKIAKENFKLKTKNANISIKGTITMVNQFINENGEHITTNVTTQGATLVTGQSGEGQLVQAGMATNVLGDQAAFKAFKAPVQLLEAFTIATDPTTSQTPNLSVFAQLNNSNDSSSTPKGDNKTSTKPAKSKEGSSNETTSNLNNAVPKSPSGDNLINANISDDKDNENTWGEWKDVAPVSARGMDNTIEEGENDLQTVVQGLINDTVTHTLNFQGQVAGSITNGATILVDNNNLMLMTLSLGGGTNNFDAIIDFDDSNNNHWIIEYTGGSASATATGFSGNFDPTGVLSGVVPNVGPPVHTPITGGSISGNYSGTSSITGIDGTWNATTGAITASGTFQADKQ